MNSVCNICSQFNEFFYIFFKSSKELTLVRLKIVDTKVVNTVRVNADRRRDFHPLTDYRTKLQNFTKGEICEFSAFLFSLQLMFDQT